jgi:hypothetical protein
MRALIALALIGVFGAGCTDTDAEAAAISSMARPPEGTVMTAYLTPTCGCCKGWVAHMEEAGYTVNVIYQDDLTETRHRLGVPDDLISCHVGVVDNYLVEGHVPAQVVTRMLNERPDIAGVAVPGMVTGTPGMENLIGTVDPYDVISFAKNGEHRVYESFR